MHFGATLRLLRVSAGWTLRELADLVRDQVAAWDIDAVGPVMYGTAAKFYRIDSTALGPRASS